MAAAAMMSRKLAPVVAVKLVVFITRMTPDAPHRAPDISQARSMIRSVRIPQLRARAAFAAVARIAFPNRV